MAQLPKGHSYTVVHKFSQDDVLEHWKHCCEIGELLNGIKRHFSVWVPLVFGNSHDSAKEEHLAEKYLFQPMTEFICGGDPAEVFSQLKNSDKPSQICGHVFKPGEPTYSCRDCANDPTCVFCIDCFQKSSHKQHRYRMNTSGGNGYCDCGDTEAWKTEPFCSLHSSSTAESSEVNPVELLPVDLANRASALFIATLQYAIDLLMWEHCVQLPEGLEAEETIPDIYHCMLFNDEVHNYDQVITTLQRAVDCSQREAIDYATIVDREGRSIVKSGTEQECEKAKEIIERNTSRHNSKPLKVLVMHNVVVAHQTFALKLIQWLQHIISQSDGLRRLFCLLSMKAPQKKDLSDGMETDENDEPLSLMERVLLADTRLWKVVRVKIHQLLMAGALMDQECKKMFAGMFTKWYEQLMKEFCLDDHDHDVSVMSLSVQLFTVPSLARWLIIEYNLLTVILQSFLTACKQKKDKDGRLCFDRNDRSPSFKRASYMLYDIKYALLARPTDPEDWSDPLRTNFLHGLVSLLELLKIMQGMDGVTRQTGQHLEFEPEWEGAFNLQLKLEDTLVLFTRWCSMDKFVLIEAYKETLEALSQTQETKKDKEKCEVAGHVTKCIKYDVSSQPVSIHLPLSRILAALHLHLETFDLTFHSPELMTKKKLEAVSLIEQPLRVQVMIAQTQAGMWRRNGFALLNQIFFYHNVRCRGEMYDRDILMLQIGASLLNPNDFVVHLLNKFNLLHWVKPEYDIPGGQEDSVRQTVMLAEEFLNLLIILLEERYIPGVGKVTQQDVIKREIVHQLCIMPMAHSELAKGLPVDPNSETGMEDVVNEVAEFRKPSSTGKGKYDLKKEYYETYCPYFYHYTKAEQSKSEEAQRKRKKQANESQALPPPVPPPLTPQFASLISILHCDVMFHIFKIVLTRTAAQRSRSWSEAQFERVLYLIGLGLHEQKRAFKEGNTSYEFLSRAMKEDGLLSKLQCLVGNQNLNQDPSKDLLSWTLKQFADVCTLKNEPVSLDALNNLASCTDQKTETERKRKAEMAAKRRARVMAQMSKMQRNFIAENSELFDQTSTELKSAVSDMDMGRSGPTSFPVVLGPGRSKPSSNASIQATCILCQEEQEITCTGKAMVLAAFVQRSTVLSQCRGKFLEKKEDYDPLFVPSDLFTGTHVGSCGHVMHHDCWQRYFDNVMSKDRRRPLRFRQSFSYDVDKMEYLCPLCEGLSNTVIPIVPSLPSLYPPGSDKKDVNLRFDDWLDGIEKTVQNSIKEAHDKESEDDFALFQPCPISTITRMMAESVAKNFQLLWEYVYDDASGHFSEGMREMLKKFARDVYAFGLCVDADDENPRVSIMAWSTCAFTIQAVEQNLRGDGKSLFGSIPTRQSDLIGSLVRFASVCSQVMNPDTVKQNCIRLLSALFPCDIEKIKKDTPCLLDLDMFHFLVILTMTLPSLYAEQQYSTMSTLPTGDLNNQHAMQLVLTAHLVQILLTYDYEIEEFMDVEEDIEGEALLKIFIKLRETVGVRPERMPSPYLLSQYLRTAVLPFLRCAAILYHYITGINPPDELHDHFCTKEYEVLCRYLSLNVNMSELFKSVGHNTITLIESWCSKKLMKEKLSGDQSKIVRYPLKKNDLVPLPPDYSELINRVSTFTCPKSKDSDDSRAPTMCLVCGKMLCSQSYCCQKDLEGAAVGAATEHAHFCGAGTGVFLRVRDCQVLLLAGKTKGCFLAPPYLDNYGETDQGLRRGNPLHLCDERYDHLKKLWFTHAIPETIAHNLEFNSSFTTIEWQNL